MMFSGHFSDFKRKVSRRIYIFSEGWIQYGFERVNRAKMRKMAAVEELQNGVKIFL